jgi:hypothetical protein
VGIGTVIDFSNGAPGYTGRLPRDARTLAVAVFDADGEHVYRTALREQ